MILTTDDGVERPAEKSIVGLIARTRSNVNVGGRISCSMSRAVGCGFC